MCSHIRQSDMSFGYVTLVGIVGIVSMVLYHAEKVSVLFDIKCWQI